MTAVSKKDLISSAMALNLMLRTPSPPLLVTETAPHGLLTSIILHIFVYITSNIFMVIMMNPFVERLESILLSLSLSNTFEDGWSHDVANCSA